MATSRGLVCVGIVMLYVTGCTCPPVAGCQGEATLLLDVGADAPGPNWSSPEDFEIEFCRQGSCVKAQIAQGKTMCNFHGESPPLDMYCALTVDESSHLKIYAYWSWQGRKVQDGETWLLTLRDSSGAELDSTGGRTVIGYRTSEDCDGEIRECYPVTELR